MNSTRYSKAYLWSKLYPMLCNLGSILTLCFKAYLFRERERKRECTSRGGAEREGDRESQAGLELYCEILTRAEIKSQTLN